MTLKERIVKLAEKVKSAKSEEKKVGKVDREELRRRIRMKLASLQKRRVKTATADANGESVKSDTNDVKKSMRERIAERRRKRMLARRLARLRMLRAKRLSRRMNARKEEIVSLRKDRQADSKAVIRERLRERIARLRRKIAEVGGRVDEVEKNFDPKSPKSYGLSVAKPSVATGAELQSLKKKQLEKAPPVLFADERVAKIALWKTLAEVDGNELKGTLYDMLVGVGVTPKVAVNVIETSVKKSAKKIVESFIKNCEEVGEMPAEDLAKEEKELTMYLTLTDEGEVEGEYVEEGKEKKKEEEKVEEKVEDVPEDVAVEAEEIKQRLTAGSVKVPKVASADDSVLSKAVAGYNTFKI